MRVDVVIIGGGIAGLWTLARLRQQGYSALLIESSAIGGVQTIASQGIIHGGTKYALGGRLGDSARAIGDMPAIWRDCLAGTGQVDLSGVRVNTEKQLLWSTPSALSRIAGFFADKMMEERMHQLPREQYPAPFSDPAFKGVVYELNEPVLDTATLVRELHAPLADYCLAGNVTLDPARPGHLVCQHENADRSLEIDCAQLVLSAGSGNAGLLEQLQRDRPQMQHRPLHMVMLRGELPAVYAHCLGGGTTPRVTITSTPLTPEDAADSPQQVWYIGGQLAEEGVGRDDDAQLEASRHELHEILPWLDFDQVQWATLRLNRAEIATPGHRRPDSSYVESEQGVTTVWPTKLAFAPRVAGQVLEQLKAQGLEPTTDQPVVEELAHWPKPGLAPWPWQQASWAS